MPPISPEITPDAAGKAIGELSAGSYHMVIEKDSFGRVQLAPEGGMYFTINGMCITVWRK